MKRFLRFLGIFILIIIAGIIILGLLEPRDITIERSAIINAPKETVWNEIANFKNWHAWYPAYRVDTNLKTDIQGTDGMTGSSLHWASRNKMVGEGAITNTSSDSGIMKYDMKIVQPYSGKADGWLMTADTRGETKVIWGVHMHCGFPINALLVFMDMDKMMGKDLELGLKNIKGNLEHFGSTIQVPANVKIEEVQFPGHIYYGMRKTLGWNEMNSFFDETYGFLDKIIKKRESGPKTGLFFDWNDSNHSADLAAVYPITDTIPSMTKSRIFNIPASGACKVEYKGPYSGLKAVHTALAGYCVQKGMKPNLKIEEYEVSRYDTEDSTKWITNIYYLCGNMATAK